MTPKIIQGTPADLKLLRILEERCFSGVDVFSLPRLKRLLVSPTARIFFIRAGGQVMGYVIGLIRNFRQPSGRVYKIGVLREFQGRGLAGLLLEHLERRFRDEGLTRVAAEVRFNNQSSLHMFEKKGYQREKILPGYYEDGEDGVKFWKLL